MKARLGQRDLGTRRTKMAGPMQIIGDRTPNSQTLTLKWADGNSASFNAGRSIDLSFDHIETGLGSFIRRNYDLSVTSTDPVRLEAIDQPYKIGS